MWISLTARENSGETLSDIEMARFIFGQDTKHKSKSRQIGFYKTSVQ